MNLSAVLRVVREVVVNIALPYAIYALTAPRLGNVHALMAASAPPMLWSVVEFIRARRVDALSLLVLAGIALSLLAFFGGGSARFLQLREKLVTIVIGVAFLASAAIGRPLMYEVIRAFLARTDDPQLAEVESLRDKRGFRRVMTVMTLVWGFGLLADGAVSIALLYVLPVSIYLVANPVLGYATIGSLTLWNVLYGRSRRRAAARAQQQE